MSNLMEKLAISKAIMDKHNNIKRGSSEPTSIPQETLKEFSVPNASYNLPTEFLSENTVVKSKTETPTKDKILNSRLPDEIKKLMLENPINPSSPLVGQSPVLSNELIEKASKLMGTTPPSSKPTMSRQKINESNDDLKSLLKEVVQEVLLENGLILEESNKTNETVLIKVGKHIFEGKISKIKKVK